MQTKHIIVVFRYYNIKKQELCDGVHVNIYKSITDYNYDIMDAFENSDLLIIPQHIDVIYM